MALAVTLLDAVPQGWDENSGPATVTITTASVSPGANCLLVCMVSVTGASTNTFGAGPTVPVSSGSGPSWTGTTIESVNASSGYNPVSGIWAVQVGGSDPGSFTVSYTYNGVSGSGDQTQHLLSLYKVTGYNTSTPTGGKEVTQASAGNGAVTITLDAAPATGDVTLAQNLTDENTTNKVATFGTGTWTTSEDGAASGKKLAYNTGYRTGSTSTSVPWSDVNSGSDNFGSTQAAVVVKVASAGVDATATPSIVTATASVPSPSVSAGANANATPTVVTATAAGIAPSAVSVGRTVTATVVTATASVIAPAHAGEPSSLLYPATVSGRKILDQNGNVWLGPNLSAWGFASLLTDAEMTTEMPRIAARGFKSMVVWIGGTEDGGAWGTGWHQHQNADGDDFWTGTPWGSSLGAAWASVDHMVAEAEANGIFCWLSFCDGNSSNKNGLYFDAVTNTDMRNAGIALATRYAASTNVGWHIMLDNSTTVGSTRGGRLNALFDGINDTEGTSLRPVRWMEVDQTASTDDQSWYDPTGATTDARMSVNCMYEYGGGSVPLFEALWADSSGPSGDCEPPYVGSPHYTVEEDRQYRQRNYSVFIEGGCLINFGHEDYWHFDADGLFTDGVAWEDVMDVSEVIEASYCWGLVDQYMKTSAWAPTSLFVTTGETNAGDDVQKAAQGTDGTTAIAYFPTNRTVAVDTTILTGTRNVRLRWFDPVLNTYSTIAASEAQQSGRSVTIPAARGDGSRDFVLVAELDPNATATPSVVTATASVPSPTASASVTVTATVVTATASVLAPTVTTGATATATVVTATASVLAPALSTGVTVTATVVTATAAVVAPSISAGGSATASPSVVTAAASVLAPTVAVGVTVTATVVTATASVVAPTVSTASDATATPAVVTATASVPSPSISAGGSASVTATVVTATASVPTPALSVGSTVTAAVVTAAAQVLAAIVTVGLLATDTYNARRYREHGIARRFSEHGTTD